MASTIDWSQWAVGAVVTITMYDEAGAIDLSHLYDETPDELTLTADDLKFLKSIKVKVPT